MVHDARVGIGLDTLQFKKSASALRLLELNADLKTDDPQPGDLIVFDHGQGLGHVAIKTGPIPPSPGTPARTANHGRGPASLNTSSTSAIRRSPDISASADTASGIVDVAKERHMAGDVGAGIERSEREVELAEIGFMTSHLSQRAHICYWMIAGGIITLAAGVVMLVAGLTGSQVAWIDYHGVKVNAGGLAAVTMLASTAWGFTAFLSRPTITFDSPRRSMHLTLGDNSRRRRW